MSARSEYIEAVGELLRVGAIIGVTLVLILSIVGLTAIMGW